MSKFPLLDHWYRKPVIGNYNDSMSMMTDSKTLGLKVVLTAAALALLARPHISNMTTMVELEMEFLRKRREAKEERRRRKEAERAAKRGKIEGRNPDNTLTD